MTIMQGKTGIPKIALSPEDEVKFFDEQTEGKQLNDFMFLRSDGMEWRKDHQRERT
jgi:hypothetical protein